MPVNACGFWSQAAVSDLVQSICGQTLFVSFEQPKSTFGLQRGRVCLIPASLWSSAAASGAVPWFLQSWVSSCFVLLMCERLYPFVAQLYPEMSCVSYSSHCNTQGDLQLSIPGAKPLSVPPTDHQQRAMDPKHGADCAPLGVFFSELTALARMLF